MLPVRPLLRFGGFAQRERYLPLLASEVGALAAIAFTEAHAGSDLAAIRTEAHRMRDAKVLQVVEGTSEIQRQIVTTYLKGGSGDRQPRG